MRLERELKKAKRGGICGCADLPDKSTQTFYGMKNSRHLFKFLPRTSHLGNNSMSLSLGQLCFLDQGARSGREMLGAVACVEVVCKTLRGGYQGLVGYQHCADPSLFSKGRETPRGPLSSSKKVLVCSTISLKQKLMSVSVSSSRIFFRAFKLSQTTSVRAKWYRPLVIDSNIICLCFFTCYGARSLNL